MRATVFGSSLLPSLAIQRFAPGRLAASEKTLPGISVIVRIATQDPRLPTVLASLNSLDYPDDKLDIVFIVEGSADPGGAIQRMASNPMREVVVLRVAGPVNRATLNNAVSWAKHEVLVFFNTATPFPADALKEIARRVSHPAAGTCTLRREWFLPRSAKALRKDLCSAGDWLHRAISFRDLLFRNDHKSYAGGLAC
jgi:cellulose synthase/poly-beta-1,6-N-acetylglucosamine synthase-like glycosyltransferase